MGMPRRTQTYFEGYGFDLYNLISTLGVFMALAGAALFAFDFFRSLRYGRVAGNDPWDARTLEWSVSSPPPVHNFDTTPAVTGVDSFWLSKHPEFDHTVDEEKEAILGMAKRADDHGVHMPGQSWFPFVVAAAMVVAGYGVIYQNWILAALMGGVLVMSVAGWAFEGVGGYHLRVRDAQGTD